MQLSPKGNQLLRIIVYVALLAVALFMALPALQRILLLLSFPYPHDGLEGTLLYEARLLRSGQALYQPLERYRFVSAPYPPLAYLGLALFDLIQGPHVFWAGRLLFCLCALGVCLLIALIMHRISASWPLAIFAAALFLTVPPLQLWATRIKPDMLALFFTSAALYLGNRSLCAPQSNTIGLRPSLILAALVCTLAFYTKQTAVTAALAIGLALLIGDWREWRSGSERKLYVWKLPFQRRTLAFALIYLILSLGTWLVLDLITGGQYSLHVWWNGDRSQWWAFSLFSKIIVLLGFWWPQMLLAAMIIPAAIQRPTLRLIACYLLVAPITLLATGETGANHNHLLETHLALTLAGCAVLGMVIGNGMEKRGARAASPLVIIVTLALVAVQVWQTTRPPDWYTGELEPRATPQRYLDFMRATPGEILADDTGLLFQAGRDLRYDDPSTMGPAAKIGRWDQSGLIEEIEQQKFSAIMIPVNLERSEIDPAGRWTPEMLAAIKAHYQLKFRDTIYVYVPR